MEIKFKNYYFKNLFTPQLSKAPARMINPVYF